MNHGCGLVCVAPVCPRAEEPLSALAENKDSFAERLNIFSNDRQTATTVEEAASQEAQPQQGFTPRIFAKRFEPVSRGPVEELIPLLAPIPAAALADE